MKTIMYLLYCVATLFSTVYGGNPDGTTVEKVIGLVCVFVFVGLFVGITTLTTFISKKIKKKKMNSSKQLKIKPLKEQWVMWIITSIIAYVLIAVICIIISCVVVEKIPWKYIGIVFAIYFSVVIIIAIISRISYRGVLIVNEDELIKLHGDKVQFRIKRENLLFIGIRRTNIFTKLLVLISAWIGDLCTDMVSFRFKEAEIFEKRKFGKTLTMSSLNEEDIISGVQEFVECVSYRQAKMISEMLNVPIKRVIF